MAALTRFYSRPAHRVSARAFSAVFPRELSPPNQLGTAEKAELRLSRLFSRCVSSSLRLPARDSLFIGHRFFSQSGISDLRSRIYIARELAIHYSPLAILVRFPRGL